MYKIIICVVAVTIVGLFLLTKLDPNIQNGNDDYISNNEVVKGVKVVITGEVLRPGEYTITQTTTLGELIAKAGGITDLADGASFDTTLYVGERTSFYIPKKMETSVCPVTTEKININEATVEQLLTLPNLDKAQANNIVSYRNKEGSYCFKCLEDIQKVTGIGIKTFENIRDYISIK